MRFLRIQCLLHRCKTTSGKALKPHWDNSGTRKHQCAKYRNWLSAYDVKNPPTLTPRYMRTIVRERCSFSLCSVFTLDGISVVVFSFKPHCSTVHVLQPSCQHLQNRPKCCTCYLLQHLGHVSDDNSPVSVTMTADPNLSLNVIICWWLLLSPGVLVGW